MRKSEFAMCPQWSEARRLSPQNSEVWRRPPSRGQNISGVESFLPTRFGVSGVSCQGNAALPKPSAIPEMIAAGEELQPTGGNKITSYCACRSKMLLIFCVLM